MQLRTYTGLWNVEKRIYKFYDFALPYPVSVKQIVTFAVSAVVWFSLMGLIQIIPFDQTWWLLWVAPPVGIAVYANRPVAEGKTLFDFCLSQVKFFVRPRVYARFRPIEAEVTTRRIFAQAWSRTK